MIKEKDYGTSETNKVWTRLTIFYFLPLRQKIHATIQNLQLQHLNLYLTLPVPIPDKEKKLT